MAAIFTLLTFNTVVFLASGTLSEALDSVAWLTLLALFEVETGSTLSVRVGLRGRRAISVIHGVRLVATAALIAAMLGYVLDKEWLDVLNVALWVAVVALLELEVHRPETVMRHRAIFSVAALALYAGLSALVVAWFWRGDWFYAYDAALWLTAFATLEIDVLGFIGKDRRAT
jgi:hypothetical protein